MIYHSRDSFSARQAAALHAGTLPAAPPGDLTAVREALGGDQAPQAVGLWRAGDGIYALGRASQPDVTRRAFDSMAKLFGVDPGRYLLQEVGRPVRWTAMQATLLRKLGLGQLAVRVEVGALRSGWRHATEAVGQVRRQMEQARRSMEGNR